MKWVDLRGCRLWLLLPSAVAMVVLASDPASACISDADCDDANVCTGDVCATPNGLPDAVGCTNSPVANGTPCADATVCNGAVGSPTDVGAYGLSASPYGSFDQGGNVFEWTETVHQDPSGLYRVKRGGSWHDSIYGIPENLSAGVRYGVLAGFQAPTGTGFRVAMIPEPGTGSLLAFGLMALAAGRRRR